jgi:LysM repeat protein
VNLTLKHKVRRGETLQGIATHYGVSAQRLAAVNAIGRQRPLRTGMIVTVPSSHAGPAPAILDPGDPRGSTGYVPERKLRVPAAVTGQSTTEGRSTVIVRRGQTLASIAEQEQVSVAEIRKWNHLTGARVRPGQHLKIRGPDAPEVTLAASDSNALARVSLKRRSHRTGSGVSRPGTTIGAGAGSVRVRPGDTLERIAKRNGVTVVELQRANGLSGSRIRAGQRLKLPEG